MKRITLILRTSEVIAVRKAACIAGADRMAAHPVSYRECAWASIPHIPVEDELVRLEVMAVDSQFDGVVSAILSAARFGKIEKISHVNAKHALSDCRLLAA